MHKKYIDFSDDVNGKIIGRVMLCVTLHKYKTGKQVGPKFYGVSDSDVIKQAETWFETEKEYYPNGLQLRIM